jgi:hypothetical protein
MGVAGLAHINLGDGSALSALFDAFAQLIQTLLTVIAIGMTAYGALRKVYHLVFPGNAVAGPQS